MRDSQAPSGFDTARNAVVAGFRVTAFLFAVGMLCLLYFIHADKPHWALFWWAFTALIVPASVFYFYGEVRFFYLGYRDAITPHATWPLRHRLLALWIIATVGALLAVTVVYY